MPARMSAPPASVVTAGTSRIPGSAPPQRRPDRLAEQSDVDDVRRKVAQRPVTARVPDSIGPSARPAKIDSSRAGWARGAPTQRRRRGVRRSTHRTRVRRTARGRASHGTAAREKVERGGDGADHAAGLLRARGGRTRGRQSPARRRPRHRRRRRRSPPLPAHWASPSTAADSSATITGLRIHQTTDAATVADSATRSTTQKCTARSTPAPTAAASSLRVRRFPLTPLVPHDEDTRQGASDRPRRQTAPPADARSPAASAGRRTRWQDATARTTHGAWRGSILPPGPRRGPRCASRYFFLPPPKSGSRQPLRVALRIAPHVRQNGVEVGGQLVQLIVELVVGEQSPDHAVRVRQHLHRGIGRLGDADHFGVQRRVADQLPERPWLWLMARRASRPTGVRNETVVHRGSSMSRPSVPCDVIGCARASR